MIPRTAFSTSVAIFSMPALGKNSTIDVGSSVSVKGLLFNTSGTPTLVTRTMREQHDD
jgi:hypothetical protein